MEDPLEKEVATHFSIHAWKIPWTEEPGELQSMGSQRVRHDLATKPPIMFHNFQCASLTLLLLNLSLTILLFFDDSVNVTVFLILFLIMHF